MAFDPVDFYHLAGEWYDKRPNDGEPLLRSVISRAYYSAFLCARAQARLTRVPESHKATIDFYTTNPPYAVGQRLKALRLLRNDADYEVDKTIVPRDAQKALQATLAILTDLGESV